MALQAALLPSTLSSVPKKCSLAVAAKDTAFLSVSQKVSDQLHLHLHAALAVTMRLN